MWLTAIGANIAGFALQAVALAFGSLALVQPILVCDLLFAVLISSNVTRRSGMRCPSPRFLLVGVVACTAGIAGFLAIGQPSGGLTHVSLAVFAVTSSVFEIV